MPKEYKFVIAETSYRYITIEADSYTAAKEEFVHDYEACKYEYAREEVTTELLVEYDKLGGLVGIDRVSDAQPVL